MASEKRKKQQRDCYLRNREKNKSRNTMTRFRRILRIMYDALEIYGEDNVAFLRGANLMITAVKKEALRRGCDITNLSEHK